MREAIGALAADLAELGIAEDVGYERDTGPRTGEEAAHGGVTGGGVGTRIPGTGGGSAEHPRGMPDLDRMEKYQQPPDFCVFGKIELTAKQWDPAGTGWENASFAIQQFTALQKKKLAALLASWKAIYPYADNPRMFAGGSPARHYLYVVRPKGWDPELFRYPVILPKDDLAIPFSAALHLFFPDYVFDSLGHDLRQDTPLIVDGKVVNPGSGSMTIDGPFPYWAKFVNEDMIAFAVDYVQTPGAFGKASTPQEFDAGAEGLKALGAGLKGFATGSAGGPIAGLGSAAVAAVSSFVIDAFGSLFAGDPQPPKWLTDLLKMKKLREGSTPAGYEAPPISFGSIIAGSGLSYGAVRTAGITCHRATIHARGTMNILEGYAEVLRRVGGGGGGKKTSLWLLAAAGAALALAG